jgi:hypothetical protein
VGRLEMGDVVEVVVGGSVVRNTVREKADSRKQ